MMSVDQIQQVRQLKYVNCLSIREIAKRTGISRNTVRKILRSEKTKFEYVREKHSKPITGDYYTLIETWLSEDTKERKKHRRTAKRMYEVLCLEHNFKGSYESVAKCVREIRVELGQASKKAYIPLIFEPGDAFQFDWGEVYARIKGKEVKLQLAALQLAYSRVFFAYAYPNQKQELLFDAHCKAFQFFGGSCRRGIYDNMRSAVKRILKGRGRDLSERFTQLCSHYLFEPDFCNPASGNEKGRVENLIGVIRRNFFSPIPNFESLDELNASLLSFCIALSRSKQHPEFGNMSRFEVFQKEKESLVQLPAFEFESCRLKNATVAPISTVVFDTNRYSVPTNYVGKSVMIKAFYEKLVISFKGKIIATHIRSFEKNHFVFDPTHYLELLVRKPRAFEDGMPFKYWDLPAVFYEYRKLLHKKSKDPDRVFAQTLYLLKDFPLSEVTKALQEALKLKLCSGPYVLSNVRRQLEDVDEPQVLTLSSRLSQYKAHQKDPGTYDELLRKRRLL